MDQLPSKYLTKKQAAQKYSFLSESSIKNLLFKNFRDFRIKVVRRIGRRILLDEEALLKYIADGRDQEGRSL